MPSYLPHSRPTEAQRTAIADVAAMMEVGDENRADESLVQQEKREEDREWAKRTDDGADGSESASTIRILDQWREERPRGVDADDFLDEVDADQALLDDLPGGDHSDDVEKRTARAVQSVAELLRHGVVHDEDADEPVLNPDDYRAFDQAVAADFPSYLEAPPQEAPPPKRSEDADDDGYFGPHVIRRASSPPPFSPG